MYIDSFWAGVTATIFAEIGTLLVWSIVTLVKRGKRHGN